MASTELVYVNEDNSGVYTAPRYSTRDRSALLPHKLITSL
jgi:hypothetical protein